MKLSQKSSDRREHSRYSCPLKPIAVLGPTPVRVGHMTMISNDAVEIQFSERNGSQSNSFNELAVIIPDSINPFLSGRIDVETISCTDIGNRDIASHSRMRKCVISLNKLSADQKRLLKGACL